jgi:WD40 repeat protein
VLAHLAEGVAQVVLRDGEQFDVQGAGFLVAEHTLVTCAHVIRNTCPGTPLSQCEVLLRFPFARGGPQEAAGRVVAEWSSMEQDVAFLRVEGDIAGTGPLPLGGKSLPNTNREMNAYGFPYHSRREGRWAEGLIVSDSSPSGGLARSRLQLKSNEITLGFSGGPVIDRATGHVAGMVSEIDPADPESRGLFTAWAIPAQTLRDLHPGLAAWSRNPYRGLQPFTAADKEQFQGRDDAIEAVLRPLVEASRRFLLLFGPSGAGKSSVVQAGVIPVLESGRTIGRWHAVLVPRPGLNLLAAAEEAGLPGACATGLAAAVRRYREANDLSGHILLVVDQFEELLAASDEGPAVGAAAELLALHESAEDAAVLLVVRDDFYSRLNAVVPELRDAARSGTVDLPARLDRPSLMKIISPPGARGTLPEGLAAMIADDVLALDGRDHSGRVPTSILPALELALTRLWENGEASLEGITQEAYLGLGRVAGGFVSWGDHALRGLKGEQRDAARRILLALVRPGNEDLAIPATRVRRIRQELLQMGAVPGKAPEAAADHVLNVLVERRVILAEKSPVPGEDVRYELAHDSLVQKWGQLRDWIEEDHPFSAWLQQAEEACKNWEGSGNRADDLASGTLLSDGQRWRKQHSLPGRLAAFLDASHRRQRRRQRFTRVAPTVVAVFLVAVGFIANQLVISHAQDVSLQLAGESANLISVDPGQAAQYAVSAYQSSPTTSAQASLSTAADLPIARILKPGKADMNSPVNAVAASASGYIATGYADGRVTVWEPGTYQPVSVSVPGENGPVESLAFSSAGVLAAGFCNGYVYLWQAPYTGAPVGRVQPPPGDTAFGEQAWSMAFERGGTLWVAYANGAVGELPSPRQGRMLAFYPGTVGIDGIGGCQLDPATAIAVSDNGEVAVAVGAITSGAHRGSESIDVYSTAAPPAAGTECPRPSAALGGHFGTITSVAFSPDGTMVASSSGGSGAAHGSYVDDWVLVQSATGRGTVASLNPDHGPVQAVAFLGNGTLALAESWGQAELWNYLDDSTSAVGGGPGGPLSLAAGRDGALVTGYADGAATAWSIPLASLEQDSPSLKTGYPTEMWDAALSPDGTLLAAAPAAPAASAAQAPDLLLWNTTRKGGSQVPLPGCGSSKAQVVSVDFSPNGQWLLATTGGGAVALVSTRNPDHFTLVCPQWGWVYWGAFSPDGNLIALATHDGVQIWNITTTPRKVTSQPGMDIRSVAFSPDGHLLAAGNQAGVLQAWNVSPQGKLSGQHTIEQFDGPVRALAFSPNGEMLAAGSYDHTVRLWNASNFQFIRQFSPNGQAVTDLAFSPDGLILATTSNDGTVRLWNAAAGDLLLSIPAAQNSVELQSVAFGARPGTLVVSGPPGQPQIWDLPPFPALSETPQQQIQRVLQELK